MDSMDINYDHNEEKGKMTDNNNKQQVFLTNIANILFPTYYR